nr:DUF2845 domain-containing protein [Pseudomonas duriflava]
MKYLKKSASKLILALCLGLTCSTQTIADSLRCGNQLINTEDTLFEVQRKCGEPASKTDLGYREIINPYHHYRAEVRVQQWVYGPWNGMYYYLTFRGDRLFSIKSLRGP